MDLKFKVAARIARPAEAVFEAVADPKELSAYFTTGGAKGRLETGARVTWDFHDFPGAFPVDANEGEGPGYKTTITMTFESLDDGRTLVEISEEGWRDTPEGLKASYGNCMGWSQMLCAMKVWIEHGSNLREGMYK